MNAESVQCIKRFIKNRLQFDYFTLNGYETERANVRDVLLRTIEYGESNSMLLIGPRNIGKTTFVNAVIVDLLDCKDFIKNTRIVHLDGTLHTDDRIALQSITLQLNLEIVADGKVFGSFSENLAFLLDSLKSGNKRTKSVIFILEEFDLFCAHHNQTLLYNLLDVAQSAQAPISVLGVTCRLDVMELLEKRVKSRFSHRQVFLLPKVQAFKEYMARFQALLTLPDAAEIANYNDRKNKLQLLKAEEIIFQYSRFEAVAACAVDKKIAKTWNNHIDKLVKNNNTMQQLQMLYDFDVSEAFLKQFIFKLISQLTPTQCNLNAEQIQQLAESLNIDDKQKLLLGLSVLELCFVIAIKQHTEIYDRDPFNFEIIFSRFIKFAKVSNSMQGIERNVALRAFEHLCNIELILPLSANYGKGQKEFAMHKLTLTCRQIEEAVQKYQALPTEIMQWAQTTL